MILSPRKSSIIAVMQQFSFYILQYCIKQISMQDQTNNPQSQKQSLQYHSKITILNHQHLLYKQQTKPYDYYFQYTFQGDLSRLNFWRQLQQTSTLIIPSQFIEIQEQERSFLGRWLGLGEINRFRVSCFFKYYNYTIGQWIDYQRTHAAVVAEETLLFVAKQLLEFANKYKQNYGMNCGQIKGDNLFITPQKTLRIYPHSIDFKGQICSKSELWSQSSTGRQQLSKQVSIQTTLTNSHAEDSSFCGAFTIQEDVRDVFLLILQMATLKNHRYFYSEKHQMVLWDAVGGVLASAPVSRLSGQTQSMLKECYEGKIFEGEWLLSRIDKILKSRVNIPKTISIQKNQQLVDNLNEHYLQIKTQRLSTLTFPQASPCRLSLPHTRSY